MAKWNGAEKEMEFDGAPKSFYRSQSAMISTDRNGKTIKTTTIRDSNGESTTTTEEFEGNKSLFDWNHDSNADADNGQIELFGKDQRFQMFETTHDPFKKLRDKWQAWKWNPYNWNNDGVRNESRYSRNGDRKEGIQWKSYKDYR